MTAARRPSTVAQRERPCHTATTPIEIPVPRSYRFLSRGCPRFTRLARSLGKRCKSGSACAREECGIAVRSDPLEFDEKRANFSNSLSASPWSTIPNMPSSSDRQHSQVGIQEQGPMVAVTEDSTLEFHDLIQRREGAEVVVGNTDKAAFVAIDSTGLAALSLFSRGLTVREVKAELMENYSTTEVHLGEFLGTFLEAGLVKSVSGISLSTKKARRLSLELRISHDVARRLCSKPAVVSYVLLACLGGIALSLYPDLRPKLGDLIPLRRLPWLLVFVVATGWISVLFHEAGHVIAAKSLGIDSVIQFGSRAFFTVTQTAVTSLWSLPSSQRYRVYLAGIVVDILQISICVMGMMLLTAIGVAPDDTGYRLLKIMIFLQSIRILTQFLVFLRTDLYYVIADLFDCKNLYSEAVTFLKTLGARQVGRGQTPAHSLFLPHYSLKQRTVIVAYSTVLIAGWMLLAITVVLTIGLFAHFLGNGSSEVRLLDKIVVFVVVASSLIVPIKRRFFEKATVPAFVIAEGL